jgi:hypothetical protein
LLQLQKTYKGDERFRLDEDEGFDVDVKNKKRALPQSFLGSLSKREEDLMKEKEAEDGKKKKKRSREDLHPLEDADGTPLQWDHGLRNIDKEKSKSLAILGQLVP